MDCAGPCLRPNVSILDLSNSPRSPVEDKGSFSRWLFNALPPAQVLTPEVYASAEISRILRSTDYILFLPATDYNHGS